MFGHELSGEVAEYGPKCTPLEFRATLHMLAEGKVDPRPLITGQVGLGGVDAALTALADPETHAKILIDPRSTATEPSPPGP